jgi:hypothetical protein
MEILLSTLLLLVVAVVVVATLVEVVLVDLGLVYQKDLVDHRHQQNLQYPYQRLRVLIQ